VPSAEIASLSPPLPNPQRDATRSAPRGLTGKDASDSSTNCRPVWHHRRQHDEASEKYAEEQARDG
jgi:hypothetical protein